MISSADSHRLRNNPRAFRRRLQVESLESRRLLTVFEVTNLLDDGPGSLRQAILDANSTMGADDIEFASELSGTIHLDTELEITDALSINGPGASIIAIDGQSASRLMHITAITGDFWIEGLTLTGGRTSGNSGFDGDTYNGGAIRSLSDGLLTIDSCTIAENYTTGVGADGGAIFTNGDLAVIDSTVSNNHVEGTWASGGAIYGGAVSLINSTVEGNYTAGLIGIGGAIFSHRHFSMTDSRVADNFTSGSGETGRGAKGGGVFAGANVEITRSTLSHNQTTGFYGHGGGMYAEGAVTIVDSTISHNKIQYGFAGGIRGSRLTMTGSILSDNVAYDTVVAGAGGLSAGTVTITDSIVMRNSAGESGGGIRGGSVTITDSVVHGNSSSGDGGGIKGGDVTIVNSTVSENFSSSFSGGGGISVSQNLTLRDSIVSKNSAVEGRGRGGGIRATTATVYVIDSTISKNAGEIGGGIYANEDVVLIRSVVSENQAELSGGGVSSHTIEVSDSDILDNRVTTGSKGGGISGREVTINHSTVTGNYTNGGTGNQPRGGGGIYAKEGFINHSIITNNHTKGDYVRGGGISVGDRMTVTSSLVSGNFTSGVNADGGGLFSDGQLYLIDSTIEANYTTSPYADGGGIALLGQPPAAHLVIQDSTVSGNFTLAPASTGGGIWALRDVTVINSTLSGNQTYGAQSSGGGLYAERNVTIKSSTITGNLASGASAGGGGIWIENREFLDQVYFDSSIIANNIASSGYNDLRSLGTLTFNYSLIEDATGLTIDFGQGYLLDVDPLLGPLANNGGHTLTHALLSGSPALNTGNNVDNLAYDQRGAPYVRVYGGQADMGAFEAQPVTVDGDFNDDGLFDCADIDALIGEISADTHALAYDLTGDALVNLDDRNAWLAEAGELNLGPGQVYLLGDANLDGNVDGQDCILWNTHKFTEVAAWCAGDFNADGLVDGQDFVIWNGNKFTSSDAWGVPFGVGARRLASNGPVHRFTRPHPQPTVIEDYPRSNHTSAAYRPHFSVHAVEQAFASLRKSRIQERPLRNHRPAADVSDACYRSLADESRNTKRSEEEKICKPEKGSGLTGNGVY